MLKDVYHLSAFTKNGEGGNPAGIVLKTEGLTEPQMQMIAQKVGYSETAFVFPSNLANYQIRYFTPNEEVSICGHATVATFSLLLQKGLITPGNYIIETKAGLLKVKAYDNHSVHLEQTIPVFGKKINREEVVTSLGIELTDFMEDWPIQVVSTGLRDIFIPVKSLDVLCVMKPNFSVIKNISKKYQSVGFHVFTPETINDYSDAHCRNFAPLYEIDEESATGTANAALACYLKKYRDLHRIEKKEYRFEQGYGMGRPSEIFVHLECHLDTITKVNVGGFASSFQQIEEEKHV